MSIIFSCVIPCSQSDLKSQKLQDLIASIKAQDFPQDQIEILVITEGDSESAKAIGIRRAQGEICAMFCADNMILTSKYLFESVKNSFEKYTNLVSVYSKFYEYKKEDNSLNRYFSLIGNNDPICFYLGKCDRRPYYEYEPDETFQLFSFQGSIPSLGDNGFFTRRSFLMEADLDHYYPMDVYVDIQKKRLLACIRFNDAFVWHRTSDNLFTFLRKRYRYAKELYSDRSDRRWKMVDTKEDYSRLGLFVIFTLSIIPCLIVSLRGFIKVRDRAWFWHWPVCLGFLITYGVLACRNILLSRSLFQPWDVKNLLKSAFSPSGNKAIQTTR